MPIFIAYDSGIPDDDEVAVPVPFVDAEDIASVLVPLAITDSNLTSVSAGGVALPEDAEPAWDATVTYAEGSRVHSVVTHRVYESRKAGNLNKDPTNPINQNLATGVGTWWLDIGPTNKFAAFDGLVSTPIRAVSPLTITLHPGAFNALALLKLEADGISVTVRSSPGGPIIYGYNSDLERCCNPSCR